MRVLLQLCVAAHPWKGVGKFADRFEYLQAITFSHDYDDDKLVWLAGRLYTYKYMIDHLRDQLNEEHDIYGADSPFRIYEQRPDVVYSMIYWNIHIDIVIHLRTLPRITFNYIYARAKHEDVRHAINKIESYIQKYG